MKQAIFIVILISLALTQAKPKQMIDISNLPVRTQYWVRQSLLSVSETVEQTIRRSGNRGGACLAIGLLLRNENNDRQFAYGLIDNILNNQYTDQDDIKSFGVWKKYDLPDDQIDYNWREFVGIGMVVILEEFGGILPDKLRNRVEDSVLMAAKGAMDRNVGADYTNIAMMSAFLMDYAGNISQNPKMIQFALSKAKAIYDPYRKYNAVSEFNSPTYAGVNMYAISLWRKYGRSKELKKMGEFIEEGLWEEVSDYYNPCLKNLAGPYFRAYGMDMNKYNAIAGLWIALALQDERLEPLPGVGYRNTSELNFVSIGACAGVNVPETALAKLTALDKPRQVSTRVNNNYPGNKIKSMTAYLTSSWMAGGAVGHRRDWNQIVPGTIHWKLSSSDDIGWIMVPSKMKCDISADKDGLKISKGGFKGDAITLLIYCPNIKQEYFTKNQWKLPSIVFDIKSELILDDPVLIPLDAQQQLEYTRDTTKGLYALTYKLNEKVQSDHILQIKPNK